MSALRVVQGGEGPPSPIAERLAEMAGEAAAAGAIAAVLVYELPNESPGCPGEVRAAASCRSGLLIQGAAREMRAMVRRWNPEEAEG
jgi:hypothetical protein